MLASIFSSVMSIHLLFPFVARHAYVGAAFSALYAALLPFMASAPPDECQAVLLTSQTDGHTAALLQRITHIALANSCLEQAEWLQRDWLTTVSCTRVLPCCDIYGGQSTAPCFGTTHYDSIGQARRASCVV
jgi:hypothetical protein